MGLDPEVEIPGMGWNAWGAPPRNEPYDSAFRQACWHAQMKERNAHLMKE